MTELLAPAGTLEAFNAAISSGANAIYLGLDKFSARAYAQNFTLENLEELTKYAHLRNVKIYVTINTIIYEKELNEVFLTIDKLAAIAIDGIISQDLAVINYITSHYESLHAHASTQLGIDDIYGAEIAKKLGLARIVFARETPVEVIKDIKTKLNIEAEVFIHGALCVAYSGNCLMSSMIGDRSGNRGRCAGCCRKKYSLINSETQEIYAKGYLLSLKDLNTSSYINDLSFVDSLKIEGRMKEPEYVASVVSTYRKIIDNEPYDKTNLNKVFNRTYTKGFIFGESSKDISNIERPNNYGFEIGYIYKIIKNKLWIKLNLPLSQGDQIRIESNDYDEISLPITQLFDTSFNRITSSSDKCIIYCDKKIRLNAKIYKTKDTNFYKNINQLLMQKEYKKIPLNFEFQAILNKNLFLKVSYKNIVSYANGKNIIEEAKTISTTRDNIINQLSKLNDTPYFAKNIEIKMDNNLFIPLKELNELRRNAINNLNEKRLKFDIIYRKMEEIIPNNSELLEQKIITAEVTNDEQYKACKELGIEHIYYKNIVRRNNSQYVIPINNEILVGGLNGLAYYKNKCDIITDYSLNTTNHLSCAILSYFGAKRITLSEEISKDSIIDLVNSYHKHYQTYPNLELIVYGRSILMHSKYCPLKRLNMCGQCKKNNFLLNDDFASFPMKFNDDCTVNILNSKKLNLLDDLANFKYVNYLRFRFYDETPEEIKALISTFRSNLTGKTNTKLFNNKTDTHGHFLKNPL